MTKFYSGTDNRMNIVILIVLVVIIVIGLVYVAVKETKNRKGDTGFDGDGDYYLLGRGSEKDTIDILLKRIEWASYLERRKNLWQNTLVVSSIIAFFVIVGLLRRLPKPNELIFIIAASFITIYASRQMVYVHGDVYNDYYIKNNARLIRRKLDLPENDNDVPVPNCAAPDRIKVMSPI